MYHSILLSEQERNLSVSILYCGWNKGARTKWLQTTHVYYLAVLELQRRVCPLAFPDSGVSAHSIARVSSPRLQGWHGSISLAHLYHSSLTPPLTPSGTSFHPQEGSAAPAENAVYTDRNNGTEAETDCFSFFQSTQVSFPLLCSSHTVWVPPIQGFNFGHRNWCWEDTTNTQQMSFYRVSLVAQSVKNLSAVQETWVRSLGRSPGEGNSNPLQYPCLENLRDSGAW